MSVSVSFAVQAHPARSVAASRLAAELGGDVVWDPEPDGRKSPWRTFQRLLETTPPDATHRFQIQDDATACPGLRAAVERAAAAQPDRLLVFYVGKQQLRCTEAVLAACRADRTWAELPPGHFTPVVSTCWPRPLIDGILAYVGEQQARPLRDPARWPPQFVADDEIVSKYLRLVGQTALASVPSLVDHEDAVPSVMGRFKRERARLAACYVGDCGDCVDGLDWTLPPHP